MQSRCYSIHTPATTLTATPPCCYDDRPEINACRRLSIAELRRFQGLPPDAIIPEGDEAAYIGRGTDGSCVRAIAGVIASYLSNDVDINSMTAFQQHCAHGHPGKRVAAAMGLPRCYDCPFCPLGHSRAHNMSKKLRPKPKAPLLVAHGDFKVLSCDVRSGCKYLFGLIDPGTSYMWMFPAQLSHPRLTS